jgi:thiol-disulfide isomerase/thioredoxin
MLKPMHSSLFTAALVLVACQNPPASAPSAQQPVKLTPQPAAQTAPQVAPPPAPQQPAPQPAPSPAPQPAPQVAPQPAPEPTAVPAPAGVQDPSPTPDSKPAEVPKLPWFEGGLEKALAEAKASKKLVFADFNASWCTWCMKMNREVFANEETVAALASVICVSIDYDKQRETAEKYLVGKELPVVIWFNSDGTVRERIEQFQSRPVFLANTARIKADIGTLNDLRRKVEANPADLDQRYELHRRLKAVGDASGAAAQRAAIEKADPQGESRAMHHFKYEGLHAAIDAHWAQTRTLDPKLIEGLRNFMEIENDPEIMWDGWMSLANTYSYWGEQAKSRGEAPEAKRNRGLQRECLARAWRGIPQDDDTLRQHVTGYTSSFWDLRDELSADDKALLLTMNEMVARRLESEALVQHSLAQALFLSGKTEAAQAACEHAIEIAKATGQDPQNYEKTLALIRGGAK